MSTTISKLILSLKGDRTYEQLAADCGGTPTAGRIQQLATKPQSSFASPDTLRGLARGLRVPTMVVIRALAESLGLEGGGEPRLAELLPPETNQLTDGQVSALLHLIKEMTQYHQPGGPEAHHTGPMDLLSPKMTGVRRQMLETAHLTPDSSTQAARTDRRTTRRPIPQ